MKAVKNVKPQTIVKLVHQITYSNVYNAKMAIF